MLKRMNFVVLIIVITIISISDISCASFELKLEPIENVAFDPNAWDPTPEVNNATLSPTVTNKIGPILGAIQTVGAVISVLALMLIGIKTMIGSVEEKTQYKEAMPGYLIGIFLVFSMTSIPNIIYKVMK